MGRGKLITETDNKQKGRNELIAEYIEKVTGQPRNRKQVSSHIQVIKQMAKNFDAFSKAPAERSSTEGLLLTFSSLFVPLTAYERWS